MAVDPYAFRSNYRAAGAKRLTPEPDPGMTTEQKIATGGTVLGTLVGAYYANPAAGAAIGGAVGKLAGGVIAPDDPDKALEDRLLEAAPGMAQGVGSALASSETAEPEEDEHDRLLAMLKKRGY
jgi:hypothetical protein